MSTKLIILKAALSVFIKNGFAGASISQIAKAAKVNPSLIYHHFQSKEDLWKSVKQHCVNEATKNFKPFRYDTLENFITDIIEARLTVYEQSGMRMLVHWQSLESNPAKFYDNLEPHPLFDISDHIQTLQKEKLVRNDQDRLVLSAIIFSLLSYAFFDFAEVFSLSAKQQDDYRKMVYQLLLNVLANREDSL